MECKPNLGNYMAWREKWVQKYGSMDKAREQIQRLYPEEYDEWMDELIAKMEETLQTAEGFRPSHGNRPPKHS